MELKLGDLSGWAQMVVALVALVYAVLESKRASKERHEERLAAERQRREEREANDRDLRLRARPILGGTKDMHQLPPRIKYLLKNDGLGPATIQELRPMYRKGRVAKFDLDQIMKDFGATDCRFSGFVDGVAPGSVLSVGEEWTLIDITFAAVKPGFNIRDVAEAIEFGAKFESIYGDVFETDHI